MPISTKPPQEEQSNPFMPPGPKPLLFDEFMGMNLSTTRPGVDDKECYWLDGFFPIDKRNLRTLYGVGTAIFTRSASLTVVCFNFYNIGATPYMVVFMSDGSAIQVNTSTLVQTTILPAASITTPSIVNIGTSQWGAQYLIIVANQTNGYWVWDGTLLYQAGSISPVITITNVGSGYFTAPTVTLNGGHGTGSSLVAFLNTVGQMTTISIVQPGTGYVAGDTPTVLITAPVGGSGASAVVTAMSGGSVVSTSMVASGSLYGGGTSVVFTAPSNPNSHNVIGHPVIVNGSIISISLTDPGAGYGFTPTISIIDTPVQASATVTLMPFGVQGTAVETYQGRAWVANGPIVYFTAAGAIYDFSTNRGGGNFTSADSFLRVGYTQLIQSNGFLYLIGDSSINYISGVQTAGSPPTTTFTNQNADPQVGTPYPSSVEVYGRNILFANSFGVHIVAGAAATKVSDNLDGVYATVPNFGGLQLSASQAVVFGRKVWMVLSRIVNPVTGTTENKLFCWNGKKWWASSQDMTLTYIRHQEINSVITAYGTDGTVVRPLFQTASSSFTKTVQSKLWDAPGGFQFAKAATRFWAMAQYYSTVSPNLVLSIDNERGTMANQYTITGPTTTGSIFVVPPTAIAQNGVLTGMTMRTAAADMALIACMMQDEIVQYRG